MKNAVFGITLPTILAITPIVHADAPQQVEQSTQKASSQSTPFIEYNNRMAVFSLSRLTYERIKPNALYAGVDAWAALTVGSKSFSAVAEGEFRMGYNFFWNGRDHFTPIAGVGFFKDCKEVREDTWFFTYSYDGGWHEHHHRHRYRKPGIAYGTVGFLYDHEFNSIFNLGLNLKGIFGGPVSSNRHFDWGSFVGGFDIALPITFRFGRKRHWDIRVEPFNIYLCGTKSSEDYFGFRGTCGYRF